MESPTFCCHFVVILTEGTDLSCFKHFLLDDGDRFYFMMIYFTNCFFKHAWSILCCVVLSVTLLVKFTSQTSLAPPKKINNRAAFEMAALLVQLTCVIYIQITKENYISLASHP